MYWTMSLAQTSRSFFKRPPRSRLLQKWKTQMQCRQHSGKKGFKVYNLDKGILDWKELGKEISF